MKGRPNHAPECKCATHGGRQNLPHAGGAKYHKEGCQCVVHNPPGSCKSGCQCRKHRSPSTKILLEDLLVSDQKEGHGGRVKRRLIKEGLLEDCCSTCKLGPEWNGDYLTLQLDHINGNPRDWRLGNLRVLCPNCHTQTETFSRSSKQASFI